jgi:N4-gp56 family major capsid protein
MANEIVQSTTSSDQEKFLSAKLLGRSLLRLVCASVCEKVKQPKGTGLTAYFIRYQRMNVPVAALTEATDPSNSTFTLAQVTVTLDQWGDVLTLSDIVQLTTKHPLMSTVIELLSENAQRVIDREVQVVWLAGTNVMYGNATVTSRRTITTAMTLSDTIIHKARITMSDAGAPTREGPAGVSGAVSVEQARGTIRGPRAYIAICGPQVLGDIMAPGTSNGTFVAVAQYANANAMYNAEVGMWLGIRWVESNFVPKFQILGNTTTAVVSGAAAGVGTASTFSAVVVTAVDGGGTLTSATTYYFKVTAKDLTRGFEEYISIEHTMASAATGNNESFTFAFPSGYNYVYNVYFGSATGDANLKLAAQNQAAGSTLTVTAVPSSTTTAPDNVNTTGTPTVHVIYIHGAGSCAWVGLQDLKTYISGGEGKATTDNPLGLRTKVGYKFMGKTVVLDQTRMLRVEVASAY